MTRGWLNNGTLSVNLLIALALLALVLSISLSLIKDADTESHDEDLCGVLPGFRCFPDENCAPGWAVEMQTYVCPSGEVCCHLQDADEYYPEGTLLLTLRGAHEATFRIVEYPTSFEGAIPLPPGQGERMAVVYEEGYEAYEDFFQPLGADTLPWGIPKDVKMSFSLKPYTGLVCDASNQYVDFDVDYDYGRTGGYYRTPDTSPPPGESPSPSSSCFLGQLRVGGAGKDYLTLFESGLQTDKMFPPKYDCRHVDKIYGLVSLAQPFTPSELVKRLQRPNLLQPKRGSNDAPVDLTVTVLTSFWKSRTGALEKICDYPRTLTLPVSKHLESTWAKRRKQ